MNTLILLVVLVVFVAAVTVFLAAVIRILKSEFGLFIGPIVGAIIGAVLWQTWEAVGIGAFAGFFAWVVANEID